LPVARLHPPVRDTSRPAPGPDLLASTELAARLLKAAAEAGEIGDLLLRRHSTSLAALDPVIPTPSPRRTDHRSSMCRSAGVGPRPAQANP
jgi:hypothetical protein